MQKKIGILFLLLILIVNQYVWIWFFDDDGYLKQINKIRFLIVDIMLFTFGCLLFSIKFNVKKIGKSIIYIIFIISFLEFASYLTILLLINSNKQLKHTIDNLEKNNLPKFVPDLRSDYKPNKNHPDINQFGFRFGGKSYNKNSFRIMCLGGSTTWSDGTADSSNSYPAQLEYYLKEKGYNVNVINAGVPYHTSLDVLMRFITKGIYFNPDMLLIHTGLNDTGPTQSPFDYEPDYSHWRPVGYESNKKFINLWINYPFSISRLIIIFYLDFQSYPSISKQTSSYAMELVSTTAITQERTIGLKNYFSSILYIAKKNNITPVTLLINNDHSRKNSYAKRFINEKKLSYAIERDKKITTLNNSIMDSISIANNVNVIPFDKFQPSSKEYWDDHCHLTEEGIKEKAVFIGEYLINNFIIEKK